MRIPVLFFSFLAVISVTTGLRAQNPGAQQDAEEAREKLLKAADELDNVQANSEATKTSVDGMKTQVTELQADVSKLQTENAGLKQQMADMQTAFDAYKAEQVKQRQALLDSVASLVADKSSGSTKPRKKESADASAPPPIKKTEMATTAPDLAPPPDPSAPAPTMVASNTETPPVPKPQKGYYHVVAQGETLKMICTAYRENGVHVTTAEVRKANGLTEKSVLKPGQKLFIPKPEN